MKLFAAGNVIVPAIQVLEHLGYSLRIETGETIAEKDGNAFAAEDPITVLGLIKLYEIKGADWQPSDEEIVAILRKYDLDPLG